MDNSISNINFGSKTIYKMNIKKAIQGGYKLAKADFAEISPNSNNDFSFIKNLFYKWRLTNTPDKCIANIKINFQNDVLKKRKQSSKYFILKLAMHKSGQHNKTCAAASVNIKNKILEISQLQSVTSVITPSEIVPKVKGAGELIILGIIKWAKENGFKKIELVSVVDSFYENLGFKRINNTCKEILNSPTHFLDRNLFDDFIKRVENKYQIM